MTSERWRQVKEIFNSVLKCDPAERSDFLSTACGADAALLKEVESLIASHEKGGSFIDSPAYQATTNIWESDQEFFRIYRLSEPC